MDSAKAPEKPREEEPAPVKQPSNEQSLGPSKATWNRSHTGAIIALPFALLAVVNLLNRNIEGFAVGAACAALSLYLTRPKDSQFW
jgi:hypothetical protein